MKKVLSWSRIDKILFWTPISIFLVGVISIYSASRKGQETVFFESIARSQVQWMVLALLVMYFVLRVSYLKWRDWAWPIYFICIALLLLVFLMPARLGARRWIGIGGFNIQPSEVAKIALVFILANFFSSRRIEGASRWTMAQPFILTGVFFVLILKEPDLGTAMTLLPILFSMLYVWGYRVKNFFWMFGSAAILAPMLFHFLKDYQKTRIHVFLNPSADPLGAGYTIIQSKIAIGSGGLWGKGLLSGTQNQLNFIPERHTDFIFAVIGEEGGLIVCALVLFLFWILVQRGYHVANTCTERFGAFVATGIASLIGTQALVNIAMTTGLVPVVGVPLPLVSYGGTSILITMFAIGLLINIKME